MTTDDAPKEGGPEWERNQAAQQIAAALLAGDAEGVERGADRLGDAVTNATAAKLIPSLQHVLETVVKGQIRILAEKIEYSDTKAYEWRYEQRERTDHRFDNFGAELDAFNAQFGLAIAEVRGLRGDFSALQAGFQRVAADVDALKPGQARLEVEQAALAHDNERLQATVNLLIDSTRTQGEELNQMRDDLTRGGATIREIKGTIDGRTKWFQSVDQQLQALAHATLSNELGREERIRNVEFLRLLMAQHPELAAEAARRAAEDRGDDNG